MSDVVIVQLVGAVCVLTGLGLNALSQMVPPANPMKFVSARNTVSWAPLRWVYGVTWGTIFGSQLVFAVVTIFVTVLGSKVADLTGFFTQCACTSGGLAMASAWQALFVLERPATFWAAAALLVAVAIVATVGAIAAKPWLGEAQQWYETLGGASASLFAGWTAIAAGLNVSIASRVLERGVGAPVAADEVGTSFAPLALSVLVASLAIAFGNPVLPLPGLVALATVEGAFRSWRGWAPIGVCALGVAGGVAMLLVYRSSDPFW